MPFPIHRPRRLRHSEALRRLVRETRLTPSQFILPLFVCPGEGVRKEIGSMPGNAQLSVDNLVREAEECTQAGYRRCDSLRHSRDEGRDRFGGLR